MNINHDHAGNCSINMSNVRWNDVIDMASDKKDATMANVIGIITQQLEIGTATRKELGMTLESEWTLTITCQNSVWSPINQVISDVADFDRDFDPAQDDADEIADDEADAAAYEAAMRDMEK